MFIMITGTILGVALGAVAILVTSRNLPWLGWLVFGFGLIALISILPTLVAIITPIVEPFHPVISIAAGVASQVSGIGAVRIKRNKSWQVRLGLAFGAVPILFWLIFIAAELLFPHP